MREYLKVFFTVGILSSISFGLVCLILTALGYEAQNILLNFAAMWIFTGIGTFLSRLIATKLF